MPHAPRCDEERSERSERRDEESMIGTRVPPGILIVVRIYKKKRLQKFRSTYKFCLSI